MRILQINTRDRSGGAEAVAINLHKQYRSRGHDAWLAVGQRVSQEPDVFVIRNGGGQLGWSTAWWRLDDWNTQRVWPGQVWLRRGLRLLADPIRALGNYQGRENFRYPGAWHLLDGMERLPDVLHTHNLHGHYFDLRALPTMSRRLPLIMTLHDAWLLSGHCAHSLACQRWQTGCGACPDLTLYPAIRKDNTAQNWKTKRAIYQDCQLYLATPSQWLMDKVQRSMLAPAVRQARVIPYGIDLSIFRPGSQAAARQRLGLPALARVVVFVATHARQNAYKDYQTIEAAAVKLSREWRGPPLFTIALGASGNARRLGNMELRYAPFENDPGAVASYYQASDVYVHAAKADTFPNVVLEAMACGTPVVATAIGGIPEQVVEGETGLLTPPADADAMAAALERILGDDNLRAAMAQRAVERARRHYDLARQTDDYLDFYGTAIADFAKPRGVPSNE